MKNELKITISGKAKHGKSILLYHIKKLLEKEGFDISRECDADYGSNETFEKIMSKNHKEKVNHIMNNVKISIEEKTVRNQF